MNHELTTARAVAEAVGGVARLAALCGVKPNAVYNWISADRLPARCFMVISRELKRRRLSVDPQLFRFRQPEAAE
jgi:DNA-binding transcriptional regulator YdaS (Cro superfamily)